MKKGELSELATAGAMIAVRVTPKASRNEVTLRDGQLRVAVTAVPENGKANKAVQKLLAQAFGVPKSHLELIQGVTSRDKVFQIID